MAFTVDQIQGVFGEFKPVLDESVTISQDNVQGVLGIFDAALDEAAVVVPSVVPTLGLLGVGR